MALSNSSKNEYERLMDQFGPAIANRDRIVWQYSATARESQPQETRHPNRGGFIMALYRLFGGR